MQYVAFGIGIFIGIAACVIVDTAVKVADITSV